MQSYKLYSHGMQVHWSCKALLDQREISHAAENGEVRGWRLCAIIQRLKPDYGWPMKTRYHSPDNVALYSLLGETDRTALRYPPVSPPLPQRWIKRRACNDINRLRRRFGISEIQARLCADLFFGGARDV